MSGREARYEAARALINADAHGVAVAAHYEAARALINADAHGVAVAAHYEAARALINADAHGVAVAAHYEAARALINADAHGVAEAARYEAARALFETNYSIIRSLISCCTENYQRTSSLFQLFGFGNSEQRCSVFGSCGRSCISSR